MAQRKSARKTPARDARGRFKSRAAGRGPVRGAGAPRRKVAKQTGRAESKRPRRKGARPPGRRVASSARQPSVADLERASRTLGEGRLRPGAIKVEGETRRLTPTRQGFRALDRRLTKVAGLKKPRLFSYTLDIRFRGRDGRFKSVTQRGIGVPRLRDVKRMVRYRDKSGREQLIGKSALKRASKVKRAEVKRGKGKLETPRQALQRTVERQVQTEISRVVRIELGRYPSPQVTARRMGRERAAAELRKVKKRRQVTFKFQLAREV